MYARVWRGLPGPPAVRALLAVLLAAAVVVLLWTVVFPVVEPLLPLDDVAVG
jgi:hypothetical protein